MNLNQALTLALQHHQQGDLGQAESIYREILHIRPDQPDALALLGGLLQQTNHIQEAHQVLQRAVETHPTHVPANNNLGNLYLNQGHLEPAIACFQKALEQAPEVAELHNNLGNALSKNNAHHKALLHFQRAIQLQPEYAAPHNNLGRTLLDMNRLQEAIHHLQKALNLQPDSASAHANMGCAQREAGERDQAMHHFQHACALEPNHEEHLVNLAAAQSDMGAYTGAEESLAKALTINPECATAHANLCDLMLKKGAVELAKNHGREALRLTPNVASVHGHWGRVQLNLGHLQQAVESFQREQSLSGGQSGQLNLGVALRDQGHIEQAAECFHKHLAHHPQDLNGMRGVLTASLYQPGLPPEQPLKLALQQMQSLRPSNPLEPAPPAAPSHGERLRIGYLSSDLFNHPVGRNILPIIKHHDHAAFEIFLYSESEIDDELSRQLKASSHHWIATRRLTDRELAKQIQSDGIHVMIYLAAWFNNNRFTVAFHRPAPLQVSFYNGATTGLNEMDVWLTDSFLHPPEETQEQFCEQLARLPVFYAYSPPKNFPTIEPPPSIRNGFITFVSFNNPAKLNTEVIDLWARILQRLPEARLMLKYGHLMEDPGVRKRLLDGFFKHGIEADKIELSPGSKGLNNRDLAEHLSHYGRGDIALDPFPFNGATTTYQALAMGVPVISLLGQHFISRMGSSLLHHMGLPELIAVSKDDYVEKAVSLANDPHKLTAWRNRLRTQLAESPLCDGKSHARHVEDVLLDLWAHQQEITSTH
ncbi:MAG: tetratricopeptide repeat protein [Magnetococcales bacterium]|nr:tetratricopeptide repeat protein [Magnetococcales bacterium]